MMRRPARMGLALGIGLCAPGVFADGFSAFSGKLELTAAQKPKLEALADAAGGRSNLQIEAGEPAFRSITEGTREVFRKAGIDIAGEVAIVVVEALELVGIDHQQGQRRSGALCPPRL